MENWTHGDYIVYSRSQREEPGFEDNSLNLSPTMLCVTSNPCFLNNERPGTYRAPQKSTRHSFLQLLDVAHSLYLVHFQNYCQPERAILPKVILLLLQPISSGRSVTGYKRQTPFPQDRENLKDKSTPVFLMDPGIIQGICSSLRKEGHGFSLYLHICPS